MSWKIESLESRRLLTAMHELYPQQVVPVGKEPAQVSAVDMNSDGLLDLVSANSYEYDSAVSVAFGLGGGRFVAAVKNVYQFARPSRLQFADLDGDLDLDVVAGGFHNVLLLRNDGNGLLTRAVDLPASGHEQVGIILRDLDGDLDLDILTSSTRSQYVYLNDGPFNFRLGGSYPEGDYRDMVGGDFDADGDLDYAVATNFGVASAPAIYVRRNNGNGQFSNSLTSLFASAAGFRSLVFLDIDSDGDDDLLAGGAAGSIDLYRSNGNGTFAARQSVASPGPTSALSHRDLDDDGDDDLIVLNDNSNQVVIYENHTVGATVSFVESSRYVTGKSPSWAATADLNGDGLLDLAVSNHAGDLAPDLGYVQILAGRGNLSFAGASRFSGPNVDSILPHDMDSDGTVDLVSSTSGGALISWRSGSGVGTATIVEMPTTALTPADIDNDGLTDLVGLDYSARTIVFKRNIGSRTFQTIGSLPTGTGTSTLISDDIDRDGDIDFIAASSTNGDDRIHVFHNDGLGNFSGASFYSNGNERYTIALFDYDGDADLDLFSVRPFHGTRVHLNNGAGTFTTTGIYVSTAMNGLVVFDADSDGDDDLVFNDFGTKLMLNVQAGVLSAPIPIGLVGDAMKAADVDADGDLDLIATDYRFDRVLVSFNTGLANFLPAVMYLSGIRPSGAGVVDLNNDGNLDVITRHSAGRYHVSWNQASDSAPRVLSARYEYDALRPQIALQLSESVTSSLTSDDFVVRNLSTGQILSAAQLVVHFDVATAKAVVRFNTTAGVTLPDGNYQLQLPAGSISDASGQQSITDFAYEFFVRSGDATRDRTINISDFSQLAQRFNQRGAFSRGDFTYDGIVNINDFAVLAGAFNTYLPPALGIALRSDAGSARWTVSHEPIRDLVLA